MAAPPLPPELNEDVIKEILLRLPPDDPSYLIRASLVCKLWHRILSDVAFLRRYRRFHGTPPLLGFIGGYLNYNFVPTTSAFPFFSTAAVDCRSGIVLDCRHGRVLLLLRSRPIDGFLVWDPVTGEREELPEPNMLVDSAVVLCAAAGCDHCDCHGGPFLVVFVSTNDFLDSVEACVYSSEVGAWGAFVSVQLDVDVEYYWDNVNQRSGALVGDEVYFVLSLGGGTRILKYELGRHCLSTIDLLPDLDSECFVLMATEDGLLGLASTRASSLYLWSRMVNGEGVAGWVQHRVIELQAVLPVTVPVNKAKVIAFAEGVNVFFVGTYVGTFIVDLKSGMARKVSGENYGSVLPFMSFYTPDYACSKLPLPAETI